MKNKIIFVLIGISLAVAILFFFVISKNKLNTQNNLPSASNSAALLAETENSQKNIQIVEKKIKDISELPVSQQAISEGSEVIEFKDARGNKISLADFEKGTNISILEQLRKHLDSEDYDMFYCPSSGNKKEYAVYFGYDVNKGFGDLYTGTVNWMKSWEMTMLSDLHAVLFPDVNLSEEELNQKLEFKDGKFRYAEVRLQGGKSSSINYHVSLNGIIISTTPSCLEKMIETYEPLQP
jgi:hypothetical protein